MNNWNSIYDLVFGLKKLYAEKNEVNKVFINVFTNVGLETPEEILEFSRSDYIKNIIIEC